MQTEFREGFSLPKEVTLLQSAELNMKEEHMNDDDDTPAEIQF